eukprot:5795936-Pyramimonas_sp.AAC.1
MPEQRGRGGATQLRDTAPPSTFQPRRPRWPQERYRQNQPRPAPADIGQAELPRLASGRAWGCARHGGALAMFAKTLARCYIAEGRREGRAPPGRVGAAGVGAI